MTLQYNPEDASWKPTPQNEQDAIRHITSGERPLWERDYLEDVISPY